jgi:ketosteroid isomerase-like protein
MSQENVEIVRSMYEAFNRRDWRRDWDTAFRDQPLDVEFELTTPPRGPNAGTYLGREEVQSFFQEMGTAFEAWTAEPEEFFEHGDQIAVVVKGRMRPKGSSAEIENRNGHLWTIRDGTLVSLRLFAKPEEALEAAGLSDG